MTIFLAVVAVCLLAVLILYELRWRERIGKRWLQITLHVVLITIFTPAVFYMIVTIKDRQQRAADEEFRRVVLNAIHSDRTDASGLRDLLRLKYREVFEASEEEADSWAAAFFESLPQRRAIEDELATMEAMLRANLESQWQPLYELVLSSFDERAARIADHMGIEVLESKEVPIVIGGRTHQLKEHLRRVLFPNGNELLLEVHTGVVDGGTITNYPNFIVRETVNGEQDTVFVVVIRESEYQLMAGHPRHESVIKKVSVTGDPLSSAEFTSALTAAMNRAFESVLL